MKAQSLASGRVSSLSALTLPWRTLRLAGRFVVPLALWYTVGRALRYGLFYVGYRFGLHNPVVPITVLSLVVMVSVATAVAMVHSVKSGLPAIRELDVAESIGPWSAEEDESILRVIGRTVFPFMVFYLAWGWFTEDAKALERSASGRGFLTGGLDGQLAGMKLVIALYQHLYIAITATVIFFILKDLSERWLLPRLPSSGGLVVAFCEVNWTLFGLFTVDRLRGDASNWVTGRALWGWIDGGAAGDVLSLWPYVKTGVLTGLIWLVITGLILGIDAEDEEKMFGEHRVMRKVAKASGIHRPHTPREVMTRELREKWVPAIFGLRLVFKAGFLSFAVFEVLYAALDPLGDLAKRGVYLLLGPHPPTWWDLRLDPIDLGVGMVQEILRICLLAAAFELVVARVSARSGTSASDRLQNSTPGASPARPSLPAAPEHPR